MDHPIGLVDGEHVCRILDFESPKIGRDSYYCVNCDRTLRATYLERCPFCKDDLRLLVHGE